MNKITTFQKAFRNCHCFDSDVNSKHKLSISIKITNFCPFHLKHIKRKGINSLARHIELATLVLCLAIYGFLIRASYMISNKGSNTVFYIEQNSDLTLGNVRIPQVTITHWFCNSNMKIIWCPAYTLASLMCSNSKLLDRYLDYSLPNRVNLSVRQTSERGMRLTSCDMGIFFYSRCHLQ